MITFHRSATIIKPAFTADEALYKNGKLIISINVFKYVTNVAIYVTQYDNIANQ